MQVVGRQCEICQGVIKSELDGAGCARCERFFHDACVLAPKVEPGAAETYRTAADGPERKVAKKKTSRKVRCPGCGADVRKEQRERDRATAIERELHEEQRRVAASRRGESGIGAYFGMRLAIALLVMTASVLVRVCGH